MLRPVGSVPTTFAADVVHFVLWAVVGSFTLPVVTVLAGRLLASRRGWVALTASAIAGWTCAALIAGDLTDWAWDSFGMVLTALVCGIVLTVTFALAQDLAAPVGSLARGERAGLGDLSGEYLLLLDSGLLMVGFSEEMVGRGLALTGARSGGSEMRAWLTSLILFGALHGVNAVLGQDIGPTISQMGTAFIFGAIMYAVRGVTGTVIVGMAILAIFDFGVFTHSGDSGAATTAEPTMSTIGQGFAGAVQFTCLVLFVVSAKRLFVTTAAESRTSAV